MSEPAPATHYGLTRMQYACLLVIQELSNEGIPPSYDEIAHELDLASKAGVHRLVMGLQNRGWVDRRPGSARSIVLRRPVPWPPGFADECPAIEILRLPEPGDIRP